MGSSGVYLVKVRELAIFRSGGKVRQQRQQQRKHGLKARVCVATSSRYEYCVDCCLVVPYSSGTATGYQNCIKLVVVGLSATSLTFLQSHIKLYY